MERLNSTLTLILALALLAPVAGMAEPAGAQPDDHSAWNQAAEVAQRQALDRLGERDPARRLLLSLLLAPLTTDDTARPVSESDPAEDPAAGLAQAAEMAPDDILIAWAQTQCAPRRSAADCDIESAHARLRRLDPDNAYVELLAFNTTEDEAARTAAVSRAAKAPRYDNYINAIGQVLLDFFVNVEWPQPIPPDVSPELVAVGYVSAVALPAYGGLTRLCAPERQPTADAALRTDCIAVFQRMYRWPEASMLDGMIAASMLSRLAWLPAERAQWAEALRNLQWAQHQSAALHNGPEPETARAYVRDWFARGEIKAMRAQLGQHALDLSPPADWEPGYGQGD
jgi:hypothetical protein